MAFKDNKIIQVLKEFGTVITALMLILAFGAAYPASVEATAKKTTAQLMEEQTRLRKEFEAHKETEIRAQYEVRQDMRALYRVVLDGRPSPRLEKEPALVMDGGRE